YEKTKPEQNFDLNKKNLLNCLQNKIMIKIYHNTRCSTSRKGLELLKESKKEFEIIEYMKNPLDKIELKEILQKLKISPMDLIRTKEKIWKENYQDKVFSEDELIELMIEFPNLM